ncbi:hypothetical protein MMC14_005941 [Varicellaria rhodocarpa]|nr:hypothetical protein [Varicellaria rhodocarpa]
MSLPPQQSSSRVPIFDYAEWLNTQAQAKCKSPLQQQAPKPSASPPALITIEQLFESTQIENDELDSAISRDSFFDAPAAEWLNAQAQAKSKPPLPKDLAKPSNLSNGHPEAPITRKTIV